MISHKKNLVIQLFGPGTESVPITGMTGRQLEAALRHYAVDEIWTGFLHVMLRKFRGAGGGRAIVSPAVLILRHEAYSP